MGDGLKLNFWGKGKFIADGSLGGAKGIQIISQQQHSPKEYTVRGRMSGRFALWRTVEPKFVSWASGARGKGVPQSAAVEAWRRRMLSC